MCVSVCVCVGEDILLLIAFFMLSCFCNTFEAVMWCVQKPIILCSSTEFSRISYIDIICVSSPFNKAPLWRCFCVCNETWWVLKCVTFIYLMVSRQQLCMCTLLKCVCFVAKRSEKVKNVLKCVCVCKIWWLSGFYVISFL